MYKCSLYSTDPTPVRFNQTFSCYDQHYEGKADFNIATVVIKLLVVVLYMINFIYVVKTEANKLLDKLLGDFVEAGGSINLQGETINLHCYNFYVFFFFNSPKISQISTSRAKI